MGVKLRHAKISAIYSKGKFSNCGLNEGVEKCSFFNRKLPYISETVKDRPRLLVAYALSILDENHSPWMTLKAITRYYG